MDFRVNLFEDADNRRFAFKMLNRMQGQILRDADGEARRRADGSLSVAMKKPAGRKSDFDGDVMFPSALSIAMIDAATKGQRSYKNRVFDGSEGGEKIFEVNAAIGRPWKAIATAASRRFCARRNFLPCRAGRFPWPITTMSRVIASRSTPCVRWSLPMA